MSGLKLYPITLVCGCNIAVSHPAFGAPLFLLGHDHHPLESYK